MVPVMDAFHNCCELEAGSAMQVPGRSAGIGIASRASMFLAGADNPGWHAGPCMRAIDASTAGGHCRDHGNLLVTQDSVLGEPGRGLRVGSCGSRRRLTTARAGLAQPGTGVTSPCEELPLAIGPVRHWRRPGWTRSSSPATRPA
jgi:hypothetical protein